MFKTASRATAFMLYQLSVLVGIILLPVALATSRVGVHLPVGTVIDRMEAAADAI